MQSTDKIKKPELVKKYFFAIIGFPIVFWAFAFPVIKIGLTELSPVNLTIMRLFITCVVFSLVFLIFKKKFSHLKKKDILPIFLLGFLGIIIYHLGLNYGEQFVSASVSSLIIATIPIFTAILATIFLKENITLKIAFGIVISLIGVIVISTLGSNETFIEIQYIYGALGVVIASLVAAGYTIAGKKLLKRYSALSLTFYAFIFGIIGLFPFVSSSLFVEVAKMSYVGWVSVIFLSIFPTIIGYVLWYVALEVKDASKLGVYLYFIPVLSTIFSYLILDEKITLFFFLGGVLVLIGLIIVNKQKNRKGLVQ
ncbi:MAG: DMT family transporter [Candidatus Thermoplasmatota archaeon]|nr:DMT family transporter [Candidatus Thermoplasmatota archaeon]